MIGCATPRWRARFASILCVIAFLAVASGPAPASDLSGYYARIQASLISKGYLRQDRTARDAPFNANDLTRDFVAIALRQEYAGGSLSARGGSKPLLRWEDPVRMRVQFGASVSAGQQSQDLRAIRGIASRLGQVTGHPVHLTQDRPNFHVLVVNDAERRGLGGYLKANVAGLSDRSINAILSMRRNHFCMVVAVPHADRRRGYRSVVAIIRAEHGPVMRQSCMQEELAQGMGLPNDCKDARPSIFNDNEEFGVLTRHDEMLLAMLYNRNLRSGMTADQAMPIIRRLAAQTLGG